MQAMSFTDSHSSTSFIEKAIWFAVAFAAIVVLQAVGGWWLNSGSAVLRAVLTLMAIGLVASFSRAGKPWARASSLWIGAMAGSTVVLFATGPGNIWPIVLAFAAALTGAAVFIGAFLGSLASGARRRPSERA
jgi:hypothetical protein